MNIFKNVVFSLPLVFLAPCVLAQTSACNVEAAKTSELQSVYDEFSIPDDPVRGYQDPTIKTDATYLGLEVIIGPIRLEPNEIIKDKYIISATSPAVYAKSGGTIRNSIIHSPQACVISSGQNLTLIGNQFVCNVAAFETSRVRIKNTFLNNCLHGSMTN